eukprot:3229364-Pyramimonas_sp.AAC.1
MVRAEHPRAAPVRDRQHSSSSCRDVIRRWQQLRYMDGFGHADAREVCREHIIFICHMSLHRADSM